MPPTTKTNADPVSSGNGNIAETHTVDNGILVPLKEFPGEYVIYQKEWDYGSIRQAGQFISGTGASISLLLKCIVDWKITDKHGNQVVFDREALIKAQDLPTSPLDALNSAKARAISLAAFAAYSESGRTTPL